MFSSEPSDYTFDRGKTSLPVYWGPCLKLLEDWGFISPSNIGLGLASNLTSYVLTINNIYGEIFVSHSLGYFMVGDHHIRWQIALPYIYIYRCIVHYCSWKMYLSINY
jgi:hypothetical protein